MILDKKYVLHIPLSKYENDELVSIDIDSILDELIANLNQNSFYITKVESYYKNRQYDELLITIFTDGNDAIEDIFKNWFLKNNNILKQEEYAYEINNNLIIEKFL